MPEYRTINRAESHTRGARSELAGEGVYRGPMVTFPTG